MNFSNILSSGISSTTGDVTNVNVYNDSNQDGVDYLYGNFTSDDNKKLAQVIGTEYFFDLNVSLTSLRMAQVENTFQLTTLRGVSVADNEVVGKQFRLYNERALKSTNRHNISKSPNVIIKVQETYSLQRGAICSYFFNQDFVPPPPRIFNPITRLRGLTINMLRSGRVINHEGNLEVNTEGDFYEFNGKDHIIVFNITCLERIENKLKPKIVHS